MFDSELIIVFDVLYLVVAIDDSFVALIEVNFAFGVLDLVVVFGVDIGFGALPWVYLGNFGFEVKFEVDFGVTREAWGVHFLDVFLYGLLICLYGLWILGFLASLTCFESHFRFWLGGCIRSIGIAANNVLFDFKNAFPQKEILMYIAGLDKM